MREDFKDLDISFEDVLDKMQFLHDDEGTIFPPLQIGGTVPTSPIDREENIVFLKKKFLNDGVTAGAHTLAITPAADSIVKVYYAMMYHNDNAASRILRAYVKATVINFADFMYEDIAHSTWLVYPRNETGPAYLGRLGTPLFMNDAGKIILLANAIAISKYSYMVVMYSYVGGKPGIEVTGPTNCTITDIA